MKSFKDYNKSELFDKIEKISIEKSGDHVITKYDNRVISTSKVSNRYEIFDIVKYLKDKIDLLEKNFKIHKYEFILKSGIQSLRLISDKISINGYDFYKSFYILNSSDKSRRLSFNVGLYCETSNFYIISGVKNIGLTKKHLRGVTQAAEVATIGLNDETFNEQIDSIKSLMGHRISLSNVQKAILGDKEEIPQINHKKFDAFKNTIRWAVNHGKINMDKPMILTLSTESEKLKIDKSNDFYIDAFYAFQTYLSIFNRQDSHIIKTETERIMKITQWAVRNNVLESLGI